VAVYLSSHGYGHCKRAGALLAHAFADVPVELHVVASSPRWLWPAALAVKTVSWRDEPCDVGVVQPDDLTVDLDATAIALERWAASYDARHEREASWLRRTIDAVVGDVPPLAFEAAATAGIPSVAIANFSWDWIYSEMGLEGAAYQAARAYRGCGVLLEVEPAAPMPAFPNRHRVGVIGNPSSSSREETRSGLASGAADLLVLVAMRDPERRLVGLPERRPAVRYLMPAPAPRRSDVIELARDAPFSDYLAAADVVVAKPGCGIIGDAATVGTPLLYTDRSGFPEHRILAAWLERWPGAAHVDAEALRSGRWLDRVETLVASGRPEPLGVTHLDAAAATLRSTLGR